MRLDMSLEGYGLKSLKAIGEGMEKDGGNKLYKAIANICPFWEMKHEAATNFVDEIEKSNLPITTKAFAIANAKKILKYVSRQMSIAQIAQQIAKEGTDFSEDSSVNDEWLERFMDSAKFVSEEEVQILWANILAKEFEEPNSTPPSVIRILSEITPQYAKAFNAICNLAVAISVVDIEGNIYDAEEVVIVPPNCEYLKQYGINFYVLNELQILGLIQYHALGDFIARFDNTKFTKVNLKYGIQSATVIKYENNKFPVGTVILTSAGEAIGRFSDHASILGHFDEVCDFMKRRGVEFLTTSEGHD